MRKSVTLFIFLLLIGTASAKEIDRFFLGQWVVDMEKTLMALEKRAPGTAVPQEVQEVMKTMRVVVAPESIATVRNKNAIKLETKIHTATPFGVVVYCEMNGKKVRVEINRVLSDRMQLKSGATNDMDHYIWKRP